MTSDKIEEGEALCLPQGYAVTSKWKQAERLLAPMTDEVLAMLYPRSHAEQCLVYILSDPTKRFSFSGHTRLWKEDSQD